MSFPFILLLFVCWEGWLLRPPFPPRRCELRLLAAATPAPARLGWVGGLDLLAEQPLDGPSPCRSLPLDLLERSLCPGSEVAFTALGLHVVLDCTHSGIAERDAIELGNKRELGMQGIRQLDAKRLDAV